MRIVFLILFLFLFTSIFRINLDAQDITPPDRPFISFVTVDSITNNTLIFWEESDSPDLMWYYLYYEIETINGLEGVLLDSISPGISSYSHAGGAEIQSLIYSISGIDSAGNESLRTPGFHKTVHLDLEYDSCSNAMNLSWNPYLGWGNNVSGYKIYYRTSNSGYQPVIGLGKNDSTYRIESILPNTSYFFLVEAIKNDTLTSLSNLAGKYTYMPGPPTDFILTHVDVTSPSTVEIHFEFTDTSNISNFRLLRSLSETADFISLYDLEGLESGSHSFIDSISTSTDRYFYKVGGLNSCSQVRSETNPGTNILLNGQNEEDENIISWSEYRLWPTGVEQYEVYTFDNQGNEILLYTAGPAVRDFIHDLLSFYGEGYDGEVMYQVRAKMTGMDTWSVSNIITLDVQSGLAMPNAFTPNGDGVNDIFSPVFTLMPEDYLMIIYDRYGIQVFSTEDPTAGWNGQLANGSMATEGVYVYHIQYRSFTGTTREKTGQLTVFYP